jgi:hypothetical protein
VITTTDMIIRYSGENTFGEDEDEEEEEDKGDIFDQL